MSASQISKFHIQSGCPSVIATHCDMWSMHGNWLKSFPGLNSASFAGSSSTSSSTYSKSSSICKILQIRFMKTKADKTPDLQHFDTNFEERWIEYSIQEYPRKKTGVQCGLVIMSLHIFSGCHGLVIMKAPHTQPNPPLHHNKPWPANLWTPEHQWNRPAHNQIYKVFLQNKAKAQTSTTMTTRMNIVKHS